MRGKINDALFSVFVCTMLFFVTVRIVESKPTLPIPAADKLQSTIKEARKILRETALLSRILKTLPCRNLRTNAEEEFFECHILLDSNNDAIRVDILNFGRIADKAFGLERIALCDFEPIAHVSLSRDKPLIAKHAPFETPRWDF